jgi:hypothetical protein
MRYTDMLVESAESELRATLAAQYGNKEVGECYFQVYGNNGEVIVGWDLTFRRNTCVGAYMDYSSHIARANAIIQELATKYASIVVGSPRLCTKASAQASDNMSESNGDSAYSEYEQSLGGSVKLKPVAAVEPVQAPVPAKKPKAAPVKPTATPVEPQAPAKGTTEKSVTVRAVNGILKDTPYRLKTGDATNTKVMIFTAGKYTGKLEAKMFGAWLKDKAVDGALVSKVNTAIAAIK